MKKLLLFLMMAIMLSGLNAQDTITIGTGTQTNSTMAIPGYFGYHTGAYLYTIEEMPFGGGTITSVAFQTENVTGGSNRTMKIYLKEVPEETIPGTLIFSELLEGATLVYDQTSISVNGNSWNYFLLDTPFTYTGAGNLLLIYEGTGCSTSGGCTAYLYFDQSTPGKGWNKGSDYSPMNYNTEQVRSQQYRANTKFIYTSVSDDFCMPVANLTVSNITMNSADVTWEATSGEYAYELKLASEEWTSENVETGVTNSQNITFSDLTPTTSYNVRIKQICSDETESTWMTKSFKTACNNIITELPYLEHFQNGLDCWTIVQESYSDYGDYVGPMIEVVSGQNVAKFGPNTAMMAISAPFEESINNLRVYLEMRSLAYYGTDQITVGLVSDISDTNSFIPVQSFYSDANQQWISGIVTFTEVELDEDLTYYIAVKTKGSSYTTMYIKRFEVESLPECPAPVRNSVTVTAAAETATVSWVDNDTSHEAWNVYYRELPSEGEPSEDWMIQDAQATTVTLETLLPSTTYQAFVVTDCGTGDLSDKTDTVLFTTTALPVELPYIQNFENQDNLEAIEITNVSGTSAWYIGTAAPYLAEGEESGSSLYISGDNGATNTYTSSSSVALASLIVDFTEPAEYIMEFDLRVKGERSSYGTIYDYLQVYALDASQPVTNYASGTTITDRKVEINTWQHQTVVFPESFIGTVKHIIFLWKDDVSGEVNPPAAIDNISIRATNCVAPTEIEVDSTTYNTAYISWTGEADSYNVVYYKASEPSELFTENTDDNFIELIDLDLASEYVFTINSVCGEEISSPSEAIHFTTNCGAITDDIWFENFEAAHGNQAVANQMFMCYDVLYSYTANNGTFPMIYYQGHQPSAHSGYVTLEFKGPGLLALPEFSRPLNTLRFEFYANTTASSEDNAGVMEVGILTNVNDSTSFVPLQTVTPVGFSRNGSHLVGPFDFDQLPYTEGRIALRYTPLQANYGESWNLDDFKVIPIPDCPAPASNTVEISNITDAEATISWTDTDETHDTWVVYYKAEGQAEYSTITVSDQSVVLTGLAQTTTYSFYIQTDCGTEDNVSRTDIFTFSTTATPISEFPYYQTFEDLENNPISMEYRNEYANQWHIGTATGVPTEGEETTTSLYISNDNGLSNAYTTTATSYASAILPVVFGESSEYILSFDYKVMGESYGPTSMYDYLMVFMCNSGVNIPSNGQPQGEGVVVLLDKQANISTWTHASISLTEVQNTAKQIVFYWKNDSGSGTPPPAIIDNISIVGVDCATPTSLVSTATTSETAILSWQENGTSTQWNIYYKAEGEAEYSSVLVNSNPATLTELTHSTTYTAYVVSDCDGSPSGQTNTITFTTQCPAIDEYPYYEGFETSPVACWQTQLISGVENWSVKTTVNGMGAYEGNKMIASYYTSGSSRLISPIFDLASLESPSVKFAYYTPSYIDRSEEIVLQYKSTPESEWTDLMTINTPHNSWELDSIILPEPSETYQLSFLLIGHNANGAGIDAFQIYDCEDCTSAPEPEPCDAPTDVMVSNVTQTTAQITWNGSADSYEVRFNALVTETVTTTSHQYTGLIPNTLYIVEVRSVCGEQTSDWVEIYLSTLPETQPCDAPTALSASNITETTAEITWTGTADAYEFKLNSGEAEILTATSNSLTGLTPNTTYTVEVRAVCGEQTSEWVSTTFTTLEEQVVITLAEVTTTPATEVGNTSATLNGALVNAGNSENIAVGFALATVADFTLETADVQNITATLSGATFSQEVTDLAQGQTYFFRAYATNEAGTAYGEVETFTLSALADVMANTLTATIYPNPATSQATLEINGLNQDAKIVISDLQGRIISQDQISAGKTRYTINVSEMASGVYYIRIVTDNVVSTQKLIVE
jgi:hypothetical protein